MTRDTTDFETPARAATSMIVGGRLFLTWRGLDIEAGPIILAGTFPMGTFPMRVARASLGRGLRGLIAHRFDRNRPDRPSPPARGAREPNGGSIDCHRCPSRSRRRRCPV